MYGRGRNGRNGARTDPPGEDGFFEGSDNILLRIAGVKGASDVEGYEDCIPVMSFSWNLARQTTATQPPVRARRIKAAEKKRRFVAAGLTEDGMPKEPEEEASAGEAKDGAAKDAAAATENGSSASAAPAKKKAARMTSDEYQLARETALDGYDSDDFSGIEFADSEVAAVRLPKPHIGNFTVTKFNDVASPALYALILQQKAGVEVQVILTKQRAKKVEGADDSAASSSAAAAAAAPAGPSRTARANLFGQPQEDESTEAATPPIPREVVVIQEWTLFNVLLSNVSISGGSGGRPVETLSLDFGSFQYRFVDWAGKRASEVKKVPERSIIYDHLRNQVRPYAEAVQAELTKSDQLRPTASLVMGYL